MGCREDPRCLSTKPYPCLNCSATYLPCGGDCKPFIRKSATNVAGKKNWLNCCSYCIKTRSCAKVENEYLKSTRYNDPHYLKTGKGCIVNIENKYLKDEKQKRKDFKKACVEHKKTTQALKRLKKEELIEKKGKLNKAKIRRDDKLKKRLQKAKDKKAKEKLKEWKEMDKEKEKKIIKDKKEKDVLEERQEKKETKEMKYKIKQEEKEEQKERKIRRYEEQRADRAEKLQKKHAKDKLEKTEKKLKQLEKEDQKDMERMQKKQMKKDLEDQRMLAKLEKKQMNMENDETLEMAIMEKKRQILERNEQQNIEKSDKIQKKLERDEQQETANIRKKLEKEERKDNQKKLKGGVKKSKEGVKKSKEGVKKSKEGVKKSKERVKKSKEGVKKSKEGVKESKEQKRNIYEPKKTVKTEYPKNKKLEIKPQTYKANVKTTHKVVKKGKKKARKVRKGNWNTYSNNDDDTEEKDVCESGVCADAATNDKLKFICKCKKRRFFIPQCTNRTCVGVIPSPSPSPPPPPVEGTLNKITCVCKKISTKLLGNRQVCQGGQCQRAIDSNREDFLCKCLPEVKCEKITCEKDTKFNELEQAVHAKNEEICKCGLKYKKIELQDQIDQTGEPAFEVQVRRGGLEIANLEEVQEHVKNLGKSRIPCTCPTFHKHLQHSIKNVCPTGACRKALNIKSISINCKCESRKSRFCTEKTCNLKDLKPLAQPSRIIDPLFSLNINTDKNTILNSSDIQERITNYRNKHKFCKFGRCHDSFNTGEIDFICECPSPSDICTDNTCNRCVCVKEIDKKQSPAEPNIESKQHKNKRGRKGLTTGPMQGVSVTVSRKEELEGSCDCGADNCSCPRRSRLACIARFCCKQGKPLNNAYCCDMCEESNTKEDEEKEEGLEEEQEILQVHGRKAKAKAKAEAKAKAKAEAKAKAKAKAAKKETDKLSKAMKKQQSETKIKATLKAESENLTEEKSIKEQQNKIKIKEKEKAEKLTKEKVTYEEQSTVKSKAIAKQKSKHSTNAKATKKGEAEKSTKAKSMKERQSKAKPKETVEEDEEDLDKQKKLKELEMWENEEKLRIEDELAEGNVNLISVCLSGLASWIITIISELLQIIYTCVRHPVEAFAYLKEKLRRPKLTYRMTRRWFLQLYRSKMMRIKNNIANSETATMLIDEFLTNKFVKLFLPKDRATHNDLVMRTKRKIRRKEEAMYSCKHVFLLTMKRSPCMWFFYLCPDFYAPLLGFLIGCRKIFEALMAIGAIIVWTPCFVVLETFRFLFCCAMCTA